MPNPLASLPAVHRVLATDEVMDAVRCYGSTAARQAVRDVLSAARVTVGRGGAVPSLRSVAAEVRATLERQAAVAYPEVINATGVLIHTNLGRSPWPANRTPAYLALEYDLASGERRERLEPVNGRLVRYFGAEASTVVTNNAAALVLLLAAHAAGRDVLVSRGELIEIGGSFRLPEIMSASGARLVEVGCTNRTRVDDYARAAAENTAGILVVHRSNFRLDGFVETPDLGHLVTLGRRLGIPVWVDQGSGCHLDLALYMLRHEPTVQEIIAAGADAVLFSGDKLLGGPQAGVVVGTAAAVSPLRQHPLRRALRPDKTALVALAATLDAFLAARPLDVPLYRMLAASEDDLRARARRIARRLRLAGIGAGVRATRALLGGGTTPDQTIPSWAVSLDDGRGAVDRLRRARIPVIGRIEDEVALLDLRAVPPEQDSLLIGAVVSALDE
jgi:L-seryl-tRNA(Ser) seleniumtransferase